LLLTLPPYRPPCTAAYSILYYKEIKGFYPVAIFCSAVAVIIVGAALDGTYA
jgi:hypothetical protein